MEILIDNVLTITGATPEIRRFCKEKLVIDNPDYISRERMGRWTGSVPRYLHLYEEIDGNLIIPYGCRKASVFYGAQKVWEKHRQKCDLRADYKSSINLYPYQENAVQAMLDHKNGIVVMPCGSGKTQTALECVARLGLKTLWLTHTQDLLNQSAERAKACFDCDEDMFGAITAGKVNIGKGITFATVQTMCKLDLSRYRTEWAVVIVDECHHCCGSPTKVSQFYRVVNSLYAPYKFGLTATPYRSDGLDKSMYALLGSTVHVVDKAEVKDTTCPVEVECINTYYVPNSDVILNGDGTINYTALTDDLINNRDRFSKTVTIMNSECNSCSIVLANRVAYLQQLQKNYVGKSVCISSIGTSKKAKQERKEALKKLNDGEIDCIFATYQLAKEGLDCPNLRCILFATPEKNEGTVTQAVGRVSRKADGKEYGKVIDLVDSFGLYMGWYRKRLAYYRKLSCKIL